MNSTERGSLSFWIRVQKVTLARSTRNAKLWFKNAAVIATKTFFNLTWSRPPYDLTRSKLHAIISFPISLSNWLWVLAVFGRFRFRLLKKYVFLTANQNGEDLTGQTGAKLARNSCNIATHDHPRVVLQNSSVNYAFFSILYETTLKKKHWFISFSLQRLTSRVRWSDKHKITEDFKSYFPIIIMNEYYHNKKATWY